MSGGVDSSVSAAILKEQGYEVVGVFIRVWEPTPPAGGFKCTWRDDRRDAMRVAALLDIPFLTIDLSEEYKREVVDYMISEYESGRTPNPDVMCNKYVKFGAFFNWAMNPPAGGRADFVATGHYAQAVESDDGYKLLSGVDGNKDQSYFLWSITGEQLAKTKFPVGGFTKDKVRELAHKFKLPTADKKDSQGLCFIGKLNVKDFLKEFIEEKKGNVINEKGEVIGSHSGATFFTIGERHGFSVETKEDNTKPYFITDKNVENNTITVSQTPTKSENQKDNIELEKVNWILNEPEEGKTYSVQFRYRQTPLKATLKKVGEAWQAKLKKKELIPAGQSLVVYDEGECLGGGIIK